MSGELWLPIPGYPYYEVSDQANARSLDRVVVDSLGRTRLHKGVMLKATVLCVGVSKKPYRFINPRCPDGKHRPRKIANLMLLAHVGPKPFPGAVARHLDDNSLNDTLDNLAWGTYADNVDDMIRNGSYRSAPGERNSFAKLTEADVLAIRSTVNAGATQTEVAALYGMTQSGVSLIVRRKTWWHI